MKNSGKSSKPIIAAHSTKQNGNQPAPPANGKSTRGRVARVSSGNTAKRKALVLERISDGILAFDREMNPVYVNERASELLGCEPGALLGKNFWEVYPESRGSAFADACQRAFETQSVVLFDGYFSPTDSWLEGRVYPSSDGLSVLLSDRPRTKPGEILETGEGIVSKQLEKEVYELSELPFQNPNPVMRFTRDGELLFANPASTPILESWKGQTARGIPDELQELLHTILESGGNQELEFKNAGKTYAALLVPVRETGYVNLYFNDITERKQVQESVQALIHQATTGITRTSLDGKFLFVNQAFCDMLNYSEAELLGRSIWEISYPADNAKNQRLYERMVADGEPYQLEKRLLRRNGTILWVSVGSSPLRDGEGNIYAAVSIIVDITRRKRAEESLLDSARRTLYLSSLSDSLRSLLSSSQIEREATRILGLHLKANHVAYARVKGDGTVIIQNSYADDAADLTGEFNINQFIPPGMFSKFQTGRAIITTGQDNASSSGEPLSAAKEPVPFQSQIVIPLIRNGEPVAALLVQQISARAWTNEEIHLVEETAERMQAAIERARAEQDLRESEKRFRILSNTVPSMVWSTAPDGTVQYLNEHWHNYTGLSMGESISNWAELVLHPDDYERYLATWKHVLATVPDEYLSEARYRRYDGEYRWFQSRATPARDENGNVVAWYGVSTDIHDRVEKQEELQAIINQTPFMLTRCSRDLRYRFVSRAYAEMIGRTPKEVAGKPIEEIMGEAGLKTILPYVEQVLQGKRVEYETEVSYQGIGQPFVHVVYTPDYDERGAIIGWFASITDVTERRRMENELRESEERYRTIVDTANEGLWYINLNAETMYLNEPMAQMLGYSAAEILGRRVPEFCFPEDLPEVQRRIGSNLQGYSEHFDFRFRRKDGNEVLVLAATSPVRDTTGKIIGALGMFIDITERKKMEEALRIENERFMKFSDSNIIGIIIGDSQGKVLLANDYYLNLLGVSRQDFINGKVDWKKFTPPEWLPADEKAIREMRERGVCEPYEKEYVRADGTRVPVYIADAMFPGPGEEIAAFVLDITERKRAEEALRASEEKYRRIVETANEGIWEIDKDTRTLFVNPRMAEMLGYAPEEMIGHSVFEFLLPEDHFEGQNRLERAKSGISARSSEFRYRRKDGTLLWTLASTKPQLDEHGNFIGSVAMLTDISERKQYEKSLIAYARQQSALYGFADQFNRVHTLEQIYDASLDAIRKSLLCDRASILLFDEKDVMRFVAWHGLSDEYRKATEGHSPWKAGAKNPLPIAINDINTSDLSDSLKAVIIREGIGSLAFIPIVFQGRLVGKFMVYFNAPHTFHETELDISLTISRQLAAAIDRKRAEQALRESQERFVRFMQHLPGLAWIKDREGRYIYANATAEKAFNTSQEDLYGKTDREIFPVEIAEQFQRNDEQTLLEGKGIQVIETLPQTDGLVHYSLVTKFPIPGPDGSTVLIGGTAFDITERKQMEDELLSSRQRLSATYEYAPIGMVEYSTEGRYIRVNEEFCRLLGYDKEELLNLHTKDVTYEEDFPTEEALHQQLLRGEIPTYQIEKRYKRKDGSLIWVQKTRSAVRNAQGKTIYTIAAVVNISERKQAENRLLLLSEVSEYLRNLENPNELMSAVANAMGRHLHVRRCLFNEIDVENDLEIVHSDYHEGVESVAGEHRITEYSSITTKEMEKGKTVINTDSKIDPRTAKDYERTYLATGERAYIAIPLMRDERWVASLWVSDDKPRQWSREEVSLLETVAERTWNAIEKLRINAALRDSEERLRVTFNTTAVGFATLDLDTRFVDVNTAFCNIVGYMRQELLAMTCDSLTHTDYLESTREHVTQLLAGEIPSFVIEKLYVRKDRSEIWVQNSVSLVRDENGKPLHMIAISQDITERKRTAQALKELNAQLEDRIKRRTAELQAANEFLRESEATARLIIESMPDAIVITDKDGFIVHCNTQVETLFGFAPKEVLGQKIEMLIPQRFHQSHTRERLDYNEQRHRRPMGLGRELFGRRKDDSEFPVDVMLSPVSDNTTWDVMVTIRDNTQQKQAQEALRSNEEKLRKVFEILPVGISFLGKDRQILDMNSALSNILGLSKQELLEGKHKPRRYIRSDGSPMPASEFASTRAKVEQKTIYNVETGIIKENRETIWTSVNAAPVDIGDVDIVVATIDITERKKAEDALHQNRERLRTLSRRLVEVQEEERQTLAHELHDRVGQNLAALNLNLNILRSQLSTEVLQNIGTRLDDSVSLVNQILTITRNVMADLRSNVLDDYGLESALREFAEKFTQRTGIEVVSDKSVTTIPRLDASIEMTLLRIAQEALTNVARHAQASKAIVSVSMDDESVYMSIQDDGIGILSWQKANQPGSHGLRIIRERAEAFGGSLSVHSTYKKGTRIEVKIPLSNASPYKVSRERRS